MTTTEKRSEFLRKIGLFLTRIFLLDEFDPESGKYRLICSCFDRTAGEQRKLYDQGRIKPGKIVTECDGIRKKSKHQPWLAMDFVIIDVLAGLPIWDASAPYGELGEIWESFGGKWGGRFGDLGHFELGE